MQYRDCASNKFQCHLKLNVSYLLTRWSQAIALERSLEHLRYLLQIFSCFCAWLQQEFIWLQTLFRPECPPLGVLSNETRILDQQ